MLWNIVSSSKIDENAVKDIALPSSKWLGHRLRKLGDVGSNAAIFFHLFLSIFKFIKFIKMCELCHSKIIVEIPNPGKGVNNTDHRELACRSLDDYSI